jgi:hypothetical protein
MSDRMPPSGPFAVRVEPEDIATGSPLVGTTCPVARALLRRFPEATRVAVAADEAQLWFPGEDRPTLWAHDAIAFVTAFDRGEPVRPCRIRFALLECGRR